MAIRGNDRQGDGSGTPKGFLICGWCDGHGLAYAQGAPGDDSHSVAEAVKQSLARWESAPVDPHTYAGTSSSGKSKVIREVTTSRMRKGRERTAIWLIRGQVCVEAESGHLYR